jgi:integrase
MTMPKVGEPRKPVEKVRGVFWLEHDRGGQTHPDTKHLGDWWIVWKCRLGHRHREKIGPRALAKEQHQRRRTQARLDQFCLRTEQRSTPVLFIDLAARWMTDHARVMKASWTTDKHRIETLKSHCGGKSLAEITPDLIDRYRAERLRSFRPGTKKPISPTTVNKEVALLKAMLNKAITWSYLDVNPLRSVKRLPEPDGRLRYLDIDEIDRLLSACPAHLLPIVICALHTGMRRGEILGLTWDRVDMKQRFLHLVKTKTRKARSIPINDSLMEALRHLPRHLGTDYVFWNHETATRFVSIKRAWNTALKKAKITGFRFHDLRHTFASHVQMGLGDLRATQALLGHADPRMTMRYAHLSDARLRDAVKSLEHLGEGATPSAISAGGIQK